MMLPDQRTGEGERAQLRTGASQFAISSVPFNFRLGELSIFKIFRPLVLIECEPGAAPISSLPSPSELPHEADGILIKGISSSDQLIRDAPDQGWSVRRLGEYPRHLVDLTIGYDDYLTKFSSKTRSTLKRKVRKFQELSGGAIDCQEFRTTAEFKSFLPMAWELSARTYQARLLDAGLPRTAAFEADTLARAERGAVRAFILNLNARPVSYLFLPVDGSRVVYAYLGYDQKYAEHSPGTVLQLLAMERLFADPCLSVFDFTEGDGAHKRLFGTTALQCADILLVRRMTVTGSVARAQFALDYVQSLLTATLDRFGVKAALKQFIRKASS